MANVAALPVLLKELKLASIAKHWELLAQKALDEQWLPQSYLAELCELEAGSRYQKRLQRYLREADLPPAKQLSHFDFKASSGINKPQIVALAQQRQWVDQAENILLFGASGIGKTHLACGIGYALIEQGVRVKFTSATGIVQMLQRAKEALTLAEVLTRMDKYAVLIVDDIGYVKKSSDETQVLFELIAHRYETGSLIITSNQPFSAWDKIFDDNMMTVAAIDRLVHHATIIEMQGESFRKQQSMERQEKQKSRQ
ncbi:MAG: IS21-like element helper ATPase IstB [Pseudomonadales bacterium]|jgi:DNA replication protein DnaC|nr:IS21-like element helper ATPase IstB [Pseudomonadales bacterium]